jgi:hypothetical protein
MVDKEILTELYCLIKIVSESSIKLHKEEIQRQMIKVANLEKELKSSLIKNQKLSSEIAEKNSQIEIAHSEKEKLKKIIQRNIMEGKLD